MKSNKKSGSARKREMRQRRWEKEDKTIQGMHNNASALKEFLHAEGCRLPFYDWIDSYVAEFQRIAEQAKVDFPSLLGVHEVDDDLFYASNEEQWKTLGYDHLEQVFFELGEDCEDYGKRHKQKSNETTLEGSATAFVTTDGELRTTILIRQSLKSNFEHRELKYAVKIASLCHEIGHVKDFERGVNFDFENRTADAIEAEVFAHLSAFEQMAHASYRMSYVTLYDSLEGAIADPGYLGKVVNKVFERLPERNLKDWQGHLSDISSETLAKLRPSARDKLANLTF